MEIKVCACFNLWRPSLPQAEGRCYVRDKNKILDHILYSDILTGRPEFEETTSTFMKRTNTNPHA